MMNVTQASYRGLLERGAQRYAEIEVLTDHPREPRLMAYFRRENNGKFQLVRVMSVDAEHELDWFDNNLHQAYHDVTFELFSGPNHAATEDRHKFGHQILAFTGIKEALEENLP